MKTLHKQKYKCPDCGAVSTHEEWSTNDPTKILPCPCDSCFREQLDKEFGSAAFSINTKPPWITNRSMEPNRMNAKEETRATEYILAERAKEVRTSRRSREWEADRKKEVINYKPTWVKRGRKTKDLPK